MEQLASYSSSSTIPSSNDDRLAAVVAAAEVAASMYDAYQAWALKTYGDSAKTKTVTRRKYNRIMKILRGEESSSVENSKFRFWVKAKGFKIAPDISPDSSGEQVLYVPATKPGISPPPKDVNITDYKRVAVVENFYDIIYNVHVEMDGRSGKHAGQKRTYRAVAEMYAFLPREAVTRFLMSCSDCQKRMHLQYNTGSSSSVLPVSQSSPLPPTYQTSKAARAVNNNNSTRVSSHISNNNNSCNSSFGSPDEDDEQYGLVVDAGDDDEDQEGVLLVDDRSLNNKSINHSKSLSSSKACKKNGTSVKCTSRKSVTNHITLKQPASIKRKTNGTVSAKNVKRQRQSSYHQIQNGQEKSQASEECSEDQIARNSDELLEDEEDDLDGNEIEEEPMETGIEGDSEGGEEGEELEDGPVGASLSSVKEEHETDRDEEREDDRDCNERNGVEAGGGVLSGHHHSNDLRFSASSPGPASSSSPLDMTKKRTTKAISPGKKSNQSLRTSSETTGKKLASSSTKGRSNAKTKATAFRSNASSTGSLKASIPSSLSTSDQSEQHESLEEKMKTREKLLAALTALNGHRGIRPASSSKTVSSLHHPVSSQDSVKLEIADDDDDEDEEENDGILFSGIKGDASASLTGSFDPERLKAFNMFVRLFVDENLDRMVPISRQPKDKIQAIIDSCARQFPEFSDRARKRIRTYLKSCRRTRRHKTISPSVAADSADVASSSFSLKEGSRDEEDEEEYGERLREENQPLVTATITTTTCETTASSSCQPLITCAQLSSSSSYHLTSPLAEQILATACDNEYQNVKRMRLGLQPIAASVVSMRTPSPSVSDVNGNRSGHHVNGQYETDGDGDSQSFSSRLVSSSSLVNPSSFNGHLQGALMSSQVSPVFSSSSSMSAMQALKPGNAAHTSSSSLLAALCQQQLQQRTLSEVSSLSESSETNHISNKKQSMNVPGSAVNGSHKKSTKGILSVVDSNGSQESHQHLPSSSPSAAAMIAAASVASIVGSSPSSSSLLPLHPRFSLNPSEMAAVKQLISGYRESAAFLLRSADELEQLLLRQA